MTTLDRATITERSGEATAFDPFLAPAPTVSIAAAQHRARVVVTGVVVQVELVRWVGGPVLEGVAPAGSSPTPDPSSTGRIGET